MASKTVFKDIDRGAKRLAKALAQAGTPTLRVGVLSPDADVIGYDDKSIGEVAAANELGIGVPSRPFLRTWFDALKGMLTDDMRKAMQQALLYDNSPAALRDIEWRLAILGKQYADGIRESIQTQDANLQGNAQATIDKKGFDHPLVETGMLLEAIGFDLKKNRGS